MTTLIAKLCDTAIAAGFSEASWPMPNGPTDR